MHSKHSSKRATSGGTLKITVLSAQNLHSSHIYCTISGTFSPQKFKTKTSKKASIPVWNQEFNLPEGQMTIQLYEKTSVWRSDPLIGESIIDTAYLSTGELEERECFLYKEPKKKTTPKGSIKLKLHFQHSETDSISPRGTSTLRQRSILEAYSIHEELGRGGFSTVKKGKNKLTGEAVAIKIIERNFARADDIHMLHREIDIMRKLHHKNIIALEAVFEEEDKIYLVIELVTGGELFDQIISRGTYTERDAAIAIKQILEAVAYMHDNGIAHRDLKPENLLCSGPDASIIKVTDFGLSKDFGKAPLGTSCGTPDYVAPEVLRGASYNNSVDVWSVGVITYILLCGFPPFYGNTDQQIFEKILKASYDFPSPDWDDITEDAREFVQAILVIEPHERPTAHECLQAPWIISQSSPRPLSRLNSFRGGLADYNNRRIRSS